MAEIESKTDVMLALRAGTEEVHQRLESSGVFSCLMTDAVTVPQFVRALRAMMQFYAALEPRLKRGLQVHLPHYPYISRFPLLQNDLRQLNDQSNIHEDGRLHSPPSKAATLGMLYVVEGSTLGGQVLAKHLTDKLGDRLSSALSIYDLGGKLTHDHWSRVQRLLREQGESGVDVAQMVHAAQDFFSRLLAYAIAECELGH